MIKLAIVGYGKMGKEIESCLDSEFQLSGRYDIDNPIENILNDKPDVAIEFTSPQSVIGNLEFLIENNINVVCGTTGWYEQSDNIKKLVKENLTGFIYASNFSIGVNLFFQEIQSIVPLIEKFKIYNSSIEETHHKQKIDKPSGTAIRAAEFFLKNSQLRTKYSVDNENAESDELNIISKRIDNVVGNHKLIFESQFDKIILEHDAKSRTGFAEGALLAAKFIHNKKGFYKFEEIFNQLV